MLPLDRFRLDRLRNWHKPSYEAVMWLRSNTDRFRGVIHEPMMLVIDVANADDARYVETHISNNDKKVRTVVSRRQWNVVGTCSVFMSSGKFRHPLFLPPKAFVCEDPDDMEEFLRVMRSELRLTVNAVLAPTDPPEAFQPHHPIQHYQPMVCDSACLYVVGISNCN